MPKTVSGTLLPYFYKKATTVLTGYEMDLDDDGTFEEKYVANNEDVGAYTALAIKRGTITSEDGTVLNELEIGLDNVDLAFKQYVASGMLEQKEIKVYLLFIVGSATIVGSVLLYWGVLDAPKGDENWVTMTIRPFEMLEREYPRRVYQVGCNWRFCDSNCALDLTDYDYQGTISAESDGETFTIAHGQVADYFVPGYVEIIDGTYAGYVRPVAYNGTGDVVVRIPFENTIPNGTTIKIQKLCAKNPDACQNTFSNYDEYGGFPHVPKQPII